MWFRSCRSNVLLQNSHLDLSLERTEAGQKVCILLVQIVAVVQFWIWEPEKGFPHLLRSLSDYCTVSLFMKPSAVAGASWFSRWLPILVLQRLCASWISSCKTTSQFDRLLCLNCRVCPSPLPQLRPSPNDLCRWFSNLRVHQDPLKGFL